MTYQVQSSFDENFKIIANLDPDSQALTTSYADVPDSHIDYKPSPSSSFVIYQFSLYYANTSGITPGELNCFFKLQYSDDNGSTWSDWGDNTECLVGSAASFLRQRSTADIKWALNTSGWNNTKRLRLVSKEDSGSTITLHILEDFYDSSGSVSGTHKYGCSVSCMSVE